MDATCSVCGKHFEVRFSYQAVTGPGGGTTHFCSQRCHERALYRQQKRACDVCGKEFALLYAYQQVVVSGQRLNVCSTACRARVGKQHGGPAGTPARTAAPRSRQTPEPEQKKVSRIAVLNQKGGTGKTTTTVNLAAGLAKKGYRTLLVDMDAQGNVGVSLGARCRHTLYHVMMGQVPAAQAAVEVRDNLYLIGSNETLAACEIKLAQMPRGRDRVLAQRLAEVKGFDYVLLDCGPSLSLMNQNALTFADEVLIPVSCDYLSLVGVKQILKTLKMVNEILRHPITILGVLPTFYDRRNRISRESVATLSEYFKDRVLPPIRVNTRLKEAPSHRMTIFEYAPDSNGSRDYTRLVHWLIARNTGVGKRAVEASVAQLLSAPSGEGQQQDAPAGPTMGPVGRVRGGSKTRSAAGS